MGKDIRTVNPPAKALIMGALEMAKKYIDLKDKWDSPSEGPCIHPLKIEDALTLAEAVLELSKQNEKLNKLIETARELDTDKLFFKATQKLGW